MHRGIAVLPRLTRCIPLLVPEGRTLTLTVPVRPVQSGHLGQWGMAQLTPMAQGQTPVEERVSSVWMQLPRLTTWSWALPRGPCRLPRLTPQLLWSMSR